MFKRIILTIFILNVTLTISSAEQRVFQLISKEKNRTFISPEVGSFSGISLISDRMQLNIGYSFLGNDGYSISTDLLLFEPNLNYISLHTGIGGGLIFKPEMNDFSSFFYFRIPVKILYNNFYILGVPMIGTSMFEYNIKWNMNFTLSIGYQFDLYREEMKDNKKKTS